MAAPFLSIIIPAYNERHRLGATLESLGAFVSKWDRAVELIVVDNRSDDGTGELARDFAAPGRGWVKVIREETPGKGAAVRTGMLAGQGEYLFMCDADLSMPVEQLPRFYEPPCFPHDVAIASRELPGSRRVGEPLRRHVMGRAFNWAVQALALPGVRDSQCGFKSFSREAAKAIFPHLTLNGWAFDVEALFLARQKGLSITQVPITWNFAPDSRVRPSRDALLMLRDVVRVRLRHRGR